MTHSTRRDFVKTVAVASAVLADWPTGATAQDAAPGVGPVPGRPRPTAERFDYVVAGAGHNSLITAAYLGKAGYRVLVLEGQAQIGGGCRTSELLLPGFKSDWCSSTHGVIQRNPLLAKNELGLDRYGYECIDPDTVLHYPFRDGASFTVYRNDVERTAATIALVSSKDAATFRRVAGLRASGGAQGWFKTLGQMTGFAASRQVWESPQMQAASISGGKFFGPSGSELGTGLQAFSMLNHMAGRPFPKGGSGMLTVALGEFIAAHGGVVLTAMPVTGLILENGQCKGVECADGTKFRAEVAVVSTLHLKHLLPMAPRALWGAGLAETVDLMQPEVAMFAFHYAFTEPPRYQAAHGMVDVGEASIMEDPASIFTLNDDDARGELHTDDYPLQVCHQAVLDPSRVPDGRGLVKIEGTMTYNLKQGPEHWDAIKDAVADGTVTRYMAYTANLTKDKIMATHVVSPLDMERKDAAMWRGSVHAFDNRIGGFAPARMPIPGLYQTGACTGPGGAISGLPGRNTAEAILRDQGREISQVVAAATPG